MCEKKNYFCHICALFTAKNGSTRINDTLSILYRECFGINITVHERSPEIICSSCMRNLYRKSFSYNTPTRWSESSVHPDDCYFCNTNVYRKRHYERKRMEYAVSTSVTLPCTEIRPPFVLPPFVLPPDEDEEMNVDIDDDQAANNDEEAGNDEDDDDDDEWIEEWTLEDDEDDDDEWIEEWTLEDDEDDESRDPSFQCPTTKKQKAKHVTGQQLRDLVKGLELGKEKSEFLAAFLNTVGVLGDHCYANQMRKRSDGYKKYYKEEEGFTYCCNINGMLVDQYKVQHDPKDWRLFIDGSVKSLKVILDL